MQKMLNISLNRLSMRPIFAIVPKGKQFINCMLDTGAEVPVWCSSGELLLDMFLDIEVTDKKFLLGGFGRKPELTDVYKIPKFILSDGNDDLIFNNLYIAASFDRGFRCDMILSASMFYQMDYAILNRNQEIPILRIVHDKSEYYLQPNVHEKHPKFIKKITCFSADDL